MQRVAKLADAKHPLLVGQLFDPVMLLEISKWEEIEERLKCREGEDEFESAREGTVYFSDTPSMRGSIMKIGGSKYDGQTRARTLYDAGVPEPFTCRLEMRFSDWKLYERTIQEYLSNVRVYSNKEFFVVTIHEAQKILNHIDGSVRRSEEETIRWNRAFSNTKTKIEKYRHMWQLKKEALEKTNPAKEEHNRLIQELEMLKGQCEILTQERDRALGQCITIQDTKVEADSTQTIQKTVSVLIAEFLPTICNFLTDIRVLGCLCKTNRSCRDYLLSPDAGKYWVCAGKLICGEEYWNDAIFDQVLNEHDERYKTMLHVCPWRSLPSKFKMNTLKGINLMNGHYEILGMKLDSERNEMMVGRDLKILLDVGGSGIIAGMIEITTHSRSECKEGDDDDAAEEDNEFYCRPRGCYNHLRRTPSEEEMEIFEELDEDRAFADTLNRYGSGFIDDVQIINKGVFAAVYYSSERNRNLLFISMHDRKKILWDANIEGGDAYGILFSPGEMWFVTDSCHLWYFGPSSDKQVATGFGGGSQFGLDGRITRAFCEMISGNSSLALAILEPLELDLYTVHAPNTKLTLFDVAADPDEKCSWKKRQSLNSDAAMLLQKEPRFKISIFMMMQAIFHFDNIAARKLISDGLKFMPYDKLRVCCWDESTCEYRLNFEQLREGLVHNGVIILDSDGREYLGAGRWKRRSVD